MTHLSAFALRFLEGPGPALLLALAWPTLWLARRSSKRPDSARRRPAPSRASLTAPLSSPPPAPPRPGHPDARGLAALSIVGAHQLVTDLALRLPGLAHWQAPTDRLFGGLFVAALALAARPSTGYGAMFLAAARSRGRLGRARPAVDGAALTPTVLVLAAAATVAWLAAAPSWAAAARAGAASATSRGVLADVVLAAGTLALAGMVVWLGGERGHGAAPRTQESRATALRAAPLRATPPRTALQALGVLALGSALQALWPMPGAAVVWRAGLLGAGLVLGFGRARALVAARGAGRRDRRGSPAGLATVGRARAAFVARTSSWAARTRATVARMSTAAARLWTAAHADVRRLSLSLWRAVRSAAWRRGSPASRGRPGGSARARLALASTVGEALDGAMQHLDAAVVYAALVEDDVVRFWALTPTGALQELYRRPLAQLAAVKRALTAGSGALGSRTEARDVDDLYGHLGLPYDGPVLLAAGGRPARVVLVAGSAYGPWRRDDSDRLAAHAAALATRLAGLDEPVALSPSTAPGRSSAASNHGAMSNPTVLSPAAAPAATVDDVARLRAEVAALHADFGRFGSRLDWLESRIEGHPATGEALAGAAQLVPSPAASYLARLEAYQRLLEPLPWGVVVCDPDGRVILANTAARRLLVGAALLPGHRIDVPGPGARTLVRSLRDASSTLQGGRVPLGAMDVVVRVEPIDRPNWRQRNRLGATLVVTTAADAAAGDESVLVNLLEALRDPLVDLRLQGEALDAEVRMPMTDLNRHLAVLDGHAAGLRAVLGALAAQRSLALHRHRPEIGAVDIGDLGATTERSLRDLFALRGIRFRGVRGIVPSDVTVDVRLLEHVALAIVTGAVSTASWGSHLSVHVRHEAIVHGDPASALVVVIDMLDGGLTPLTSRRALDATALAAHPAALRVGHALAERGFPGCEAWFARRTPDDQRVQLCVRLPVGRAA